MKAFKSNVLVAALALCGTPPVFANAQFNTLATTPTPADAVATAAAAAEKKAAAAVIDAAAAAIKAGSAEVARKAAVATAAAKATAASAAAGIAAKPGATTAQKTAANSAANALTAANKAVTTATTAASAAVAAAAKAQATATAASIAATTARTAAATAAAAAASSEVRFSTSAVQAKALSAFALGARGKGVVVAVIDSGVNITHQDLVARVDKAKSYDAATGKTGTVTDTLGHGTMVASIIAGSLDGVGMHGVAPEATIIPVKVMAAGATSISEGVLIAGIQYATGKASVVNLSLGSSGPMSPAGVAAMTAAVKSGQVLAVAVGNDGAANPSYPARYAKEPWANGQIIAVGAVDANNTIASFSARAGDTKNFYLVALGVGNIGATANSNTGYAMGNGTSFASPIVAGAAAVVKGYWTYLTAPQIAQVLFRTATHLGTSPVGTADAVYGWGAVNLEKSLQPIGVTGLTVQNGKVVVLAGSSALTGIALSGALQTAAASGALQVSGLDELGRNFYYDLGGAVSKTTALTAQQVFGASDRQLSFADRIIDKNGSRLTVATDSFKGDLQYGSMYAYETRSYAPNVLSGMAMTHKFDDGSEAAFGTMGMQNFFGLTGVELADTPLLYQPALNNSYFSLVPGATTLGYGKALGDGWKVKLGLMSSLLTDAGLSQYGQQMQSSGASMTLAEVSRKFGDAVVGMSLANLNESTSVLGMTGQQAFAIANAPQTKVTTVNGAWRITPGMALAAYYSMGTTHAFTNGAASLMTDASDIHSTAYGMGLVKSDAWKDGDRLSFSVSQPMRAVSGTMTLNVPTGMTDEGVETRETRTVSLASPARELMLEANYTAPLNRVSSIGFSLISRHSPGGMPGPSENIAALRYSHAF